MGINTALRGLLKADRDDNVNVLTQINANLDLLDTSVIIPCTSASRPTTGVIPGVAIFETDTKRYYSWDSAKWIYLGGGTPPKTALTPLAGGFTAPIATPYLVDKGSGFAGLTGSVQNVSAYTPNVDTPFGVTPIPVALRPIQVHFFLVALNNVGASVAQVNINPDGSITMARANIGTIPAGTLHSFTGIEWPLF